MFNLGKLSKLLYTFRNTQIGANVFNPATFAPFTPLSLIDINRQYFAGRPKQPKTKIKEKIKSAAYSDEKAAKLSKAEEEAEAKKKKMEAEKAKLQKSKKPETPIRTQHKLFEERLGKKRLTKMVEKMKRELLGLPEEPREARPARPKTPVEVKEANRQRRLKSLGDQINYTPNTMPRNEKPTLRKKVPHAYMNTEEVVNEKFREQVKPLDTPPENSTRTGLIAFKVGMVGLFDKWGVRHPLTVLQVDRCQVVQVKTPETDGYCALQIGAGEKNLKNVIKPEIGHFVKANVPPKQVLREFQVTPENILPPGYQLNVRHFTPGQYVDVSGVSTGKGFQGTVKRFGFKCQPATHGNSKSHRMLGSTGQRQDPGRVFKNKKMPGRMGGNAMTTFNLMVYKIDTVNALIYVKGSVPGKPGSPVFLRDAIRKKTYNEGYLNHPTFVPQLYVKYAQEIVMKPPEEDPFEQYLHDNDLVDRES